jgi:energy-coupling factor transporter ATP-binding protein EcfA2
VIYIPEGMDVFVKLSGLCSSFRAKVQLRLPPVPAQLVIADQFGESTAAGRYVRSLNEKSDEAVRDKLSSVGHLEEERRRHLSQLVDTAKGQLARQKPAELRRAKNRLEQLRNLICGVEASLSTEAQRKCAELFVNRRVRTEAARLASREVFKQDPITGMDTDPWRVLFNAAREFSVQVAYPAEVFPVTREGALCVWCQQPLSADASDRLARFQQFVLDDAASKKTEAEKAVSAEIEALRLVNADPFASDGTLYEELRVLDKNLAERVEAYLLAARFRRARLLEAFECHEWSAIADLPESVTEDLARMETVLEGKAAEFDKAQDPIVLATLQRELDELDDRVRLEGNLDSIRSHIQKKRLEAKLRECDRFLDTAAITRAGSELMDRILTAQMHRLFEQELKFFSPRCVPLKLKKSGARGKTQYQLLLERTIPPTHVLSEGEQRVVAIASFLAELGVAGGRPTVVFDDPVSSLDHLYRERVAQRLAIEAKERQVVVFTHDIVMVLALKDQCAKLRAPLHVHTIRRGALGPGESPDPAFGCWAVSNTKDRIGILKQTAARFRKLQQESPEAYAGAVRELYGKLREAWERAIEEVVLNDVIQRFRPSVETTRLRAVSLENEDYIVIEREMKECSTRMCGHDSAAALASPLCTPEDVERSIAIIEKFIKTVHARNTAADREMKTLLEPPPALIADRRSERIEKLLVAER